MARPSALGLSCALAALVALAAALTTVGIAGTWANDNLPSTSDMPWWMIVLLAAGSVSAVLAILTILLQCCSPGWSIVTCVLGLLVHAGMLIAYTLYLSLWFTLQGLCYMGGCSLSSLGLDDLGFSSSDLEQLLVGEDAGDTGNAFDYWSWGVWTSEMKALYIFGCAVGVFCWMVALPCAVGSMAVAKRRRFGVTEQQLIEAKLPCRWSSCFGNSFPIFGPAYEVKEARQALRSVNSELSALEQKRAGLAAQKEALEAKLASLGAAAEEPAKKAAAKRGGGGRTKAAAAAPAAKKKRSSSGGDSDEEWRP
ncbi:putative myosin-7B [Chlorella sorokiniana]|uniref:Myosin-7B n=1 Tax=Chlorella sorokiniana TaxID=3076 RepID=A0A2P6TJ49_CHLSO|nr:putative myosin-7B [Chlorella sorokiniana]|eukprot:PRW39249.1 putative myosin-7B [Chlorella sorokiniana]